jgi:L-asparaginase
MGGTLGQRVVVLGTGGTIAGVSTTGRDRDYQAAQLGAAQLLSALPDLEGVPLEAHQVCQVDSKDMGWPQWRALLQACLRHLARPEVDSLVITHGTDTLEETALLLHLVLPTGKPVVLTAAMRPASSEQADGPANLRLAVQTVQTVARLHGHGGGVVVALQGRLWAGVHVRKVHSWHIDAFDGGGAPALSPSGPWLPAEGLCNESLLACESLPWVPCLISHADADARMVEALRHVESPPKGWVVACTGHGTVHADLAQALASQVSMGVPVWRTTRVSRGGVSEPGELRRSDAGPGLWPVAGALTPTQARLALSLGLALGGVAQAEAVRCRLQQVQHPGLLMA